MNPIDLPRRFFQKIILFRIIETRFISDPFGCGGNPGRFLPTFEGETDQVRGTRGIYAALDFETSFSETVIKTSREADAGENDEDDEKESNSFGRYTQISENDLRKRSVIAFVAKKISLVDMRPCAALSYRVSSDALFASDHEKSHEIGSHVIESDSDCAGIAYNSRMTGRECVLLYKNYIDQNNGSFKEFRADPLIDESSLDDIYEKYNAVRMPNEIFTF